MTICVICPSRGNAGAALEAYRAFADTVNDPAHRFLVVVDEDDPARQDYFDVLPDADNLAALVVPVADGGCMNAALNYAAVSLVADTPVEILGFIGDDHRFRTQDWDIRLESAMAKYAIAYGNDLWQGESLPTAVFLDRRVVEALGWYGLPGAKHLYLDNTWLTLGQRVGSIVYLPDMVVEHVHPAAGKAEWDDNHLRVNRPEVYEHDRAIFERWLADQSAADVAAVKAALE